jgi:ribosomal protein S27E
MEHMLPDIDDIKILENYTYWTLKLGCKECGFMHVIFQAAISVEQKNKVFFLSVECPSCDVEYKDIMAMREIND